MEDLPLTPKQASKISNFLETITGEYYFMPDVRIACLALLTENHSIPFAEVRSRAIHETIPAPIAFNS